MTDLTTNLLYDGDNLDSTRRYPPNRAVCSLFLDLPFRQHSDA